MVIPHILSLLHLSSFLWNGCPVCRGICPVCCGIRRLPTVEAARKQQSERRATAKAEDRRMEEGSEGAGFGRYIHTGGFLSISIHSRAYIVFIITVFNSHKGHFGMVCLENGIAEYFYVAIIWDGDFRIADDTKAVLHSSFVGAAYRHGFFPVLQLKITSSPTAQWDGAAVLNAGNGIIAAAIVNNRDAFIGTRFLFFDLTIAVETASYPTAPAQKQNPGVRNYRTGLFKVTRFAQVALHHSSPRSRGKCVVAGDGKLL
ncbi:hypothetical protein CCP3SC15_1430003 [Gammaproteobacteria bacterium]